MTGFLSGGSAVSLTDKVADRIALALRLGLGSVFVIGGWWKLSRVLDPARADALVSRYMASDGYINLFFQQYLFDSALGAVLSPWNFLLLLSAFELVTGLALLAGLWVRGLSFVYAFLLWTFVMALPVVTAPGAGMPTSGYFSPALLVQVRDIGLSGMFFVLFNLGSGAYALDRIWLGRGYPVLAPNWNALGLLLRLSVALLFLVGGFFAGYDRIKTLVPSPLLLGTIGIVLAAGVWVRPASLLAVVVIGIYVVGKISPDMAIWDALNAVKREIAFIAASLVLMCYGGGNIFRPVGLLRAPLAAMPGKPYRHR